MTDISFDRLRDVAVRDAWRHEANDFTPWLAANIDHIAEAIGVPLELTGTEVSVGTFYADILARNSEDGSVVLIENQLEPTDHRHLGQILTYLASLQAHTVVWITPSFREEHLSAIRWLNENTSDAFSFFALRLRVVRIAESPLAPIFETVVKPNNWERRVRQVTAANADNDPQRESRTAFWDLYAKLVPEIVTLGVKPEKAWNCYFPMAGGKVLFSVYIAQRTCGCYLRAPWSGTTEQAAAFLASHGERLEERLGARFGGEKDHFFVKRLPSGFGSEAEWPALIKWFEEQRLLYLGALQDLSDSPSSSAP